MKHTQGEWLIINNSRFEDAIKNNNGVRIAEVKSYPSEENEDGFKFNDATVEERVANAKLIAAAPELLYALKRLLDYTRGAVDESDFNWLMNETRAIDAIEKATI
jgi:hypothetical protein